MGHPSSCFVPSSRSYGHHQNFCVVDSDRTFLAAQIPPKAAPTPQLGRTDKTRLDRIAMDVTKLFDPFLLRPQIEVVKPTLPDPMGCHCRNQTRTGGCPGSRRCCETREFRNLPT